MNPAAAALLLLAIAPPLAAQVNYRESSPWHQRADSGPDAAVPGWFYNLGITGMRARLLAEEPKALRIEDVFPGSPAMGLAYTTLLRPAEPRQRRLRRRRAHDRIVRGRLHLLDPAPQPGADRQGDLRGIRRPVTR